jgi:hypothetical protein
MLRQIGASVNTVKVTKYYSNTSRSSLAQAAKILQQLQEKHPDRQYRIQCNMRKGYRSLSVVQYEEVTLEMPVIDLPEPKIEEFPGDYGGYSAARRDYREWVESKWKPLHERLQEKLNR